MPAAVYTCIINISILTIETEQTIEDDSRWESIEQGYSRVEDQKDSSRTEIYLGHVSCNSYAGYHAHRLWRYALYPTLPTQPVQNSTRKGK